MTKEDKEFYLEAPKSVKRELFNLQQELFEQGFGKNNEFPQKVCRDEAFRIIREKYKDENKSVDK